MNPTAKYLIICGNSPDSLHGRWLHGQIPLFDVLLSPYGGATATAEGPVKFVHRRKVDDRSGLITSIIDSFDMSGYDFIMWIPDDVDVPGGAETINRLFVSAERDGFDLCQPAMLHESANGEPGYGVYEPLWQKMDSLYHCTSMIEAMCPIFSQRAWKACEPSLRAQVNGTGWGLESAWTVLLGSSGGRTKFGGKIGVIDKYPVRHTRPAGNGNDDTAADMKAMQTAFGHADWWPRECGGAFALPSTPPVSLTMVVWNEAHRLGRMLAWHHPFIAESIVVVQDSADDTLNVTASFADKILYAPSVGYCEAHRGMADSAAAYEWRLTLDADEFLSEHFRWWLSYEFVGHIPPWGHGFRLRRQLWMDGAKAWPADGSTEKGDAQYRFYRSGQVRFLDEIHTEPQPLGISPDTFGDDSLSVTGWSAGIEHVKSSSEQRTDEERCHALLSAGGPLSADPLRDRKLAMNTLTGLTT